MAFETLPSAILTKGPRPAMVKPSATGNENAHPRGQPDETDAIKHDDQRGKNEEQRQNSAMKKNGDGEGAKGDDKDRPLCEAPARAKLRELMRL